MPLAAEIGTFATTARPFTLTVAGLDVLADPNRAGLGVALDSITIRERGPGGVSSIDFTISDPAKVSSVADGAEIVYWNNTSGTCLFRGWVDALESVPDFGDQGRSLRVTGIGIEALLDWIIVEDIALQGVDAADFAAHGGQFYGIPRAVNAYPSAVESSLAAPISRLWRQGGDTSPAPVAAWPEITGDGRTLRESLIYLATKAAAEDTLEAFGATPIMPMLITLDFLGGLRMWRDEAGVIPSDYTSLTVSDAGPLRPEFLRHRREPGQLIRAVYVTGANAASTGLVSDGSGIRGRQAYVNDPTNITTAALRDQAARRILRESQAGIVRGDFRLLDFTPTETVHAGSMVTITSAAVSLAAQQFRIMEIEKTFNGSGRQNWTVAYGSMLPAASAYLRQLTRNVLR